ncbi:BrnT family toxin [Maricaulaceae bacterium MS644]
MTFVFDPAKSVTNRAKHGIDFVQAQRLRDDDYLLEAAARTTDEPRFVIIAKLDGKHWCAVWAPIGESVRIISVRRARKEEIAAYEG